MPEESSSPSQPSPSKPVKPSESPAPQAQAGFSLGSLRRVVGQTVATVKVQGARLSGDAGEGLLAFSRWLSDRTSPADEAASAEVSASLLEKFGQLWKQWSQLLEPLRNALPSKLRAKVTDSRLTGLLVGFVVFCFVAISSGESSGGDRPQAPKPRPTPKSIQPTVVSRPYQGPAKAPLDTPPAAAPTVTRPVAPAEDPQPKPVAPEQLLAEKPALGKPGIEKPVTEKPVTEKSITEKSVTEKPAAENSVTEKPVAENSVTEKPAIENSAVENSVLEKPAIEKSSAPEPTETPSTTKRKLAAETKLAADATAMETEAPESSQDKPAAQSQPPTANAPESQPSGPAATPEKTGPEKTGPEKTGSKTVASPPAPLTPEQQLVRDMEQQFKTTAATYGDGIITSLKSRFGHSELRIQLSDAWFDLSDSQQDAIAQDLYEKAIAFDFSQLRLIDSSGHILVRNPVVGNTMIIVQRRRPIS